jgi:hypothetical protein
LVFFNEVNYEEEPLFSPQIEVLSRKHKAFEATREYVSCALTFIEYEMVNLSI